MSKKTQLLEVINSNPKYAAQAIKNMYHGRVFVLSDNGRYIDAFKKTKRGAEGYIKKQQSISYYDEYSMDIVTAGSGLYFVEILESEVNNPSNDVYMWYQYLRNIQGHEYLYNNAIYLAEKLSVNDEVMNYVTTAIDDMKNYRGLTVIEIEENTITDTTSEVAATQETNTTIETPQHENTITEVTSNTPKITYQTGTGAKGNGIEITFTSKPTEETREIIKSYGYRWGGKKRPSIWWAILDDNTLAIAQQLAGETVNNNNSDITESPEQVETNFTYPEIEIEDLDNYVVSESLSKRENDANWIFRKNEYNHTQEIQDYFRQLNNEITELLQQTDNPRLIYKLKKTLQYYKKHYFNNYIKRLENRASSPSWAVTGRAGRNRSRDEKMNNRYDKLMEESIYLDKDYRKRISQLQSAIRKDKENAIKQNAANTTIDTKFKTERKEFTYMNVKENKRVYVAGDYFICKLWAVFRVFNIHNNREVETTLNTTSTLEDAKKFVTYLINQDQEKKAV